MKITSDNVKSALYISGAIVGALVLWRAYRLAEAAGNGVAGIPGQIKQALKDAGNVVVTSVQESVASMDQPVRAAINTVKSVVTNGVRSDSNPDFVAPDYVTELPFKKWPRSALNAINAANKLRGINRTWVFEGDFAGWKVYSNGTIISPDGYYLKDQIVMNQYGSDYSNPAEDAFAVTMINNPFSGLSFETSKYPWQEQ
jgi:hypothetical protein